MHLNATNPTRSRSVLALLLVCIVLQVANPCVAYSVFTHQQIIDLAWDSSIRPLLLARYPKATEAELRLAHSYAYGGCIVQDLGYYPFGHEFFSDLTHYVRSGDFILNLFRQAQDINEYAFAIGALSHYFGDSIGHQYAVNPATAIAFPKLDRKYGPVVTYQEDPHAHVRTEFGFDIDQLAAHRFAPQRYVDSMGFRVPHRLLRDAFRVTYGLHLHEVLGPEFPAVRSYRSSARRFIPIIAYAEVVIHKHHFKQDPPDETFNTYMQSVLQADYQKRFAKAYRKPGIGAHLLALFIPIMPRIGALSYLAIKDPTVQTEELYMASVNRCLDEYTRYLKNIAADPGATLSLQDRDLDTGELVKPGAYRLTDHTYAKLLHQIVVRPDRAVLPGIRRDILAYYADPKAPIVTKRNAKAWKQVRAELEKLKQMPVATSAASQ